MHFRCRLEWPGVPLVGRRHRGDGPSRREVSTRPGRGPGKPAPWFHALTPWTAGPYSGERAHGGLGWRDQAGPVRSDPTRALHLPPATLPHPRRALPCKVREPGGLAMKHTPVTYVTRLHRHVNRGPWDPG